MLPGPEVPKPVVSPGTVPVLVALPVMDPDGFVSLLPVKVCEPECSERLVPDPEAPGLMVSPEIVPGPVALPVPDSEGFVPLSEV